MKIKVLTDSTNDMLAADKERLEIESLPLYVVEGNNVYRDGIDIDPYTLYENMLKGVHYTTSQVAYNDFLERFTELAKAGQPFIYLSFSSGISGSYQAAEVARRDVQEQYPDAQMAVVDTKAVTGALALILEKVGAAAQAGASLEELVTLAQVCSDNILHVFTVTDLNYLYRGGRLSKGSAVMGNILQIKPLMDVDPEGKLRPVEKIRGERKLIKKMVEYMDEKATGLSEQTIFITHADNLPLVDEFKKEAEKELGPLHFKVNILAPVIGTHSGPGTLAVFFFKHPIPDYVPGQ